MLSSFQRRAGARHRLAVPELRLRSSSFGIREGFQGEGASSTILPQLPTLLSWQQACVPGCSRCRALHCLTRVQFTHPPFHFTGLGFAFQMRRTCLSSLTEPSTSARYLKQATQPKSKGVKGTRTLPNGHSCTTRIVEWRVQQVGYPLQSSGSRATWTQSNNTDMAR